MPFEGESADGGYLMLYIDADAVGRFESETLTSCRTSENLRIMFSIFQQ